MLNPVNFLLYPERCVIETNPEKERYLQCLLHPRSTYSTQEPTEKDIVDTNELEKIMATRYNCFLNEQQEAERAEVLKKLQELLDTWTTDLQARVFASQTGITNSKCSLLPFGSYQIGVHSNATDIDVVCVAPTHMRQTYFFKEFTEKLRKHPEITELEDVLEAFVPVIKMKFAGIQIDMVCSAVAGPEVNKVVQNVRQTSVLYGMEETSIRSLNGHRAGLMILELVPDVTTFRLTLRAMKLWAIKRGIYGNRLGFLGGISMAILVVKICQMYPRLSPSRLIKKFFMTYSRWCWADWPILIDHLHHETGSYADLNNYQRTDCDQPQMYPMRVLTPAFPSMNATHNVSYATLALIESQLRLGDQIMNDILIGKRGWVDLFSPMNFFEEYEHYLEINVFADKVEVAEFSKFKGFVESKMRKLTERIERKQLDLLTNVCDILYLHMYPQQFKKPGDEHQFSESYFYGMKSKCGVKGEANLDLRDAINDFLAQDIGPEHSKTSTKSIRIIPTDKAGLPKWLPHFISPQLAPASPTLLTVPKKTSPEPAKLSLE